MKIMRNVNAYIAFEFLAPNCKTTLLGKNVNYLQILLLVFEQLLVSDQMEFHFSKPNIFDVLLQVVLGRQNLNNHLQE